MDEIFLTIYILFGFLLRIGIPLGVTLALGWYLRRLDAGWRAETHRYQPVVNHEFQITPDMQPCWQFINCPSDLRDECDAYLDPAKPCWEIFSMNGSLQKKCRKCAFRLQMRALAGA